MDNYDEGGERKQENGGGNMEGEGVRVEVEKWLFCIKAVKIMKGEFF